VLEMGKYKLKLVWKRQKERHSENGVALERKEGGVDGGLRCDCA
jgi:hypothetical protein